MKILVLAPHADDEVLGMGGTIARFVKEQNTVTVAVLTGHGSQPHPLWPKEVWNEIRFECRQACQILGVEDLRFFELPAACLDYLPAWEVNKVISSLIEEVDPHVVYVPFMYDLHKDHNAISYAASVASRPYLSRARNIKRILAYETLSETHLMPPYLVPAFQPNVFHDITDSIEAKIEAMLCYKSQIQPDNLPRSVSALRALAKIRGAHIGSEAAEGFILLGEYNR